MLLVPLNPALAVQVGTGVPAPTAFGAVETVMVGVPPVKVLLRKSLTCTLGTVVVPKFATTTVYGTSKPTCPAGKPATAISGAALLTVSNTGAGAKVVGVGAGVSLFGVAGGVAPEVLVSVVIGVVFVPAGFGTSSVLAVAVLFCGAVGTALELGYWTRTVNVTLQPWLVCRV